MINPHKNVNNNWSTWSFNITINLKQWFSVDNVNSILIKSIYWVTVNSNKEIIDEFIAKCNKELNLK